MDPQDELHPVWLSEDGRCLHMLDQRALPQREHWLEIGDLEAAAVGIETLAVRGAPAIGCAAAMGLAVATLDERIPGSVPSSFSIGTNIEVMSVSNNAWCASLD